MSDAEPLGWLGVRGLPVRPCSRRVYDNEMVMAEFSTADSGSSGATPRPLRRLRVARGDQ